MYNVQQWRTLSSLLEAVYIQTREQQIANAPNEPRWAQLEEDQKDSLIASSRDNLTFYGRSLTMWILGHGLDTDETKLYYRNNRLDTIVKIAYIHAIDAATRADNSEANVYACTTVDIPNLKISVNLDGYITGASYTEMPVAKHAGKLLLEMMTTTKITKENIDYARDRYARQIREYDNEERQRVGQGIEQLMKTRPVQHEDTIKQQFEVLESQITNNLVARTWGYEIEIPDAKGVEAPEGVQKGEDGSLRSYTGADECECDCDDCLYHECDCDFCETGSDSPDHCGNSTCNDCDSAEYRTIGGVQRMQHGSMFKLCKDLAEVEAELNDSAGTHIHVYAQDLTTRQVGHVMAAYTWLDSILRPIAGRKNVNYAREVSVRVIGAALRKNNPILSQDKPVEVNCLHLFNDRGTIEFRQMDCNANATRITAWAWLVRGFVTAAKRGATLTDYTKCTDLNDVIAVLKRFNVEPNNEHPEQIIYGSKHDRNLVAPLIIRHRNS